MIGLGRATSPVRAWTAPRTWVAGETVTASLFNTHLRDNLLSISSVPAARVYHSAAQAIANGTLTALAFDSEQFDTDTIHDTATNNSRLTCKTAGKYAIWGNVEWVSAVGSLRQLQIRHSAAGIVAADILVATSGAALQHAIATLYQLAVNEYVELMVWQNAGVSVNVNAAPWYSPFFMMQRLSD